MAMVVILKKTCNYQETVIRWRHHRINQLQILKKLVGETFKIEGFMRVSVMG